MAEVSLAQLTPGDDVPMEIDDEAVVAAMAAFEKAHAKPVADQVVLSAAAADVPVALPAEVVAEPEGVATPAPAVAVVKTTPSYRAGRVLVDTTPFMAVLWERLRAHWAGQRQSRNDTHVKEVMSHAWRMNGRREFNDLDWLRDTAAVLNRIDAAGKAPTRISYLSAALVLNELLTKGAVPGHPLTDDQRHAYQRAREVAMKLDKERREEQPRTTKAERMKTHWLSWDEVENRAGRLRRLAREATNRRKGADHETQLVSLVADLYSRTPPRGTWDYFVMRCLRSYPLSAIGGLPPAYNYYIQAPQPSFVFTAATDDSTHGSSGQVLPVPPGLNERILAFLSYRRARPAATSTKSGDAREWKDILDQAPYLLATRNEGQLPSSTQVTRLLQQAFGGGITCDLLRNVFKKTFRAVVLGPALSAAMGWTRHEQVQTWGKMKHARAAAASAEPSAAAPADAEDTAEDDGQDDAPAGRQAAMLASGLPSAALADETDAATAADEEEEDDDGSGTTSHARSGASPDPE